MEQLLGELELNYAYKKNYYHQNVLPDSLKLSIVKIAIGAENKP